METLFSIVFDIDIDSDIICVNALILSNPIKSQTAPFRISMVPVPMTWKSLTKPRFLETCEDEKVPQLRAALHLNASLAHLRRGSLGQNAGRLELWGIYTLNFC